VTRREAWLSAGAVFLVALVVRTVAAAAVSFPVPEGTAYYPGVARNLVEGRGLVSDALWSYQTQPLVVPRAAFEVWMPLSALVEALPMALAGTANWFRAAQVASVLASSIVAVLAWRLGADVAAEMGLPVGRARTLGVGTGLAAAVLGPLVIFAALPDSTALFAAVSLAGCLLMTRIAAGEATGDAGTVATGSGAGAARAGTRTGAAAGAARTGTRTRTRTAAMLLARIDRRRPSGRLVALGLLLGLTALTRSEAIWLALAWAVMAWFGTPGGRRRRLRLIAVPAVVAALVFAPWAARNWLVFGTPLPGQTMANALYLHTTDIFSWWDQPSLTRYLSQGPGPILEAHLAGIAHDLLGVLTIPAFPISVLGLVALPWVGRRRALRPLVLFSVLTFLITSLAFPVVTLSGTFMHAAGSVLVLLVICAVVALDAFVAWVGRLRHWTRPVAWLGPAFAIATLAPLCFVTVSDIARQANDARTRYEVLPAAMARAGVPLDGSHPVITDNPIWLAEAARVPALALPEESPEAVLDLARHFGAQLVVIRAPTERDWPDILRRGGTASNCFSEVQLTDNSGEKPPEGSPLATIHVFRIVCA
jgi:hypothetical protein